MVKELSLINRNDIVRKVLITLQFVLGLKIVDVFYSNLKITLVFIDSDQIFFFLFPSTPI